MKDKHLLKLIALFLLVMVGFGSCNSDDENNDVTPPGKLTVTEVIPTHGGAKIVYTLPDDNDILFVKAKYTTTLGQEVFKSASYYTDTIDLDGFNDTRAHQVALYVVDRNNNHSEAVSVEVTPFESYIYLVQENLILTAGFGEIKVDWENTEGKTVHVKIVYSSESGTDSTIFSSKLKVFNSSIRNLDSVDYTITSVVKDNYENSTGRNIEGVLKPRFEEKIDKSTWTLVPTLSVDANAWEGVTENFWDGVIDICTVADDNSYFMINRDDNGGSLNYPLDIVIDFNKQVVVNRFRVWQRAFDYNNRTADNVSDIPYYYQVENLRAFNLYASQDKETWILLGEFDIGDPKDEDGNVPAEAIQEAIDGHEFNLAEPSQPFRYLKFAITANYGSDTYVNGSEITLYGLDNMQQ